MNMPFLQNWSKVGYTFSQNWYDERFVLEAWMARPRPKSSQVNPSELFHLFRSVGLKLLEDMVLEYYIAYFKDKTVKL